MTDEYRNFLVKDLYELEVNCNICIEELADDITEDCKKFYQQGRADAIDGVISKCDKEYQAFSDDTVCKIWLSDLEKLKEQKNELV